MSISDLATTYVHASTSAIVSGKSDDTQNEMVDELITRIKQGSDEVRTEAWLSVCEIGAATVKPLAGLMAEKELEVARAAKRGLWRIVRHAGRPGADDEKHAVVAELIFLLGDHQPVPIRREVLWMLSEVGGDESVSPIAAVLPNKNLREDARMALERIPGKKPIAALKTALKTAPEDFKLNLAQSLRARGVRVGSLSCVKLVPTKRTNVKAIRLE